ncbi:hypothetical protein MUN89_04055 [Halobacillus salinarum]|uniref:Uncharacterized protein n=1 Tax=Halobacillus salinarum TaxID=2932257 RepID=A0ABY4ELU0_9BACI|nr:hypothetical protein [Halobacillus salinarum]UOQ45139.1 hypothetical protein MUN89_04055 [Halobacillus salinarum]
MEISHKTFHRSAAWIHRNARPLEAARWQHSFANGSREEVIRVLASFQNDDGGFGHGIEPDFWLPKSSPMATWAAGQVLVEANAEADEQVVHSLLDYLMNASKQEGAMWSSVLPENNQYPHAPWWHWREGVQSNWMYNPSVELAAFLIHWSPERSSTAKTGWTALKKAIVYVKSVDDMDMHEINNFQKALDLLEDHRQLFEETMDSSLEEAQNKVNQLAYDCANHSPSEWLAGYQAMPLDFVDGPHHPLCKKFGTLLDKNLDFYIEQLNQEGIWDVSWEWEDYDREFAVAKRQWQGILTLKRYQLLRSFGRIS